MKQHLLTLLLATVITSHAMASSSCGPYKPTDNVLTTEGVAQLAAIDTKVAITMALVAFPPTAIDVLEQHISLPLGNWLRGSADGQKPKANHIGHMK